MATYGYCRVSTAAQASEGESLDVQRRVLEGWAQGSRMRNQRLSRSRAAKTGRHHRRSRDYTISNLSALIEMRCSTIAISCVNPALDPPSPGLSSDQLLFEGV